MVSHKSFLDIHRLYMLFQAVSLIKDLICSQIQQAVLDPKIYKQKPLFCNFIRLHESDP